MVGVYNDPPATSLRVLWAGRGDQAQNGAAQRPTAKPEGVVRERSPEGTLPTSDPPEEGQTSSGKPRPQPPRLQPPRRAALNQAGPSFSRRVPPRPRLAAEPARPPRR